MPKKIQIRRGDVIFWPEIPTLTVVFYFESLNDCPVGSFHTSRALSPSMLLYAKAADDLVFRVNEKDPNCIRKHPNFSDKFGLKGQAGKLIFVGTAILGGLVVKR